MNYKIIATILRKELLETLRDRRTLFAMIGVPILLYPALFIGMTQFTLIQQGKLSAQKSQIAIIGESSSEINEWISNYHPENEDDELQEIINKIEFVNLDADANSDIRKVLVEKESSESIFKKYKIDSLAICELNPEPDSPSKFDNIVVDIKFDNTIPTSSQAKSRLIRIINEYGTLLKDQRLEKIGITKSDIQPVTIKAKDIAPPEKTAGSLLGRILPMFMIINLALGAFYPALDQTAGEKERGTFETLLSTPARKTEIVTGKFLTVFTLALITAILSLSMMGLTMVTQLGQMAGAAGAENNPLAAIQISASTIVIMFLILIPLAFFICSVMMSIALFARNFREAQHYVTPFYLAVTIPAIIVALFPTVELTTVTMLIPILNVTLLLKELLIGNFPLERISGVFISTAGWATLALTISVKLFQSEQLILNQEKGLPITLKRSLIKPGNSPTIGLSFGIYALCLLLTFYIGHWLQSMDIIPGLLASQWGLILIPPILIVWFYKIDIKNTFSFRLPPIQYWLFAVLLVPASLIIVLTVNSLIAIPMSEETAKQMQKAIEILFATDGSWSRILLLVFAIGITPGICEEVLFRGSVLSGFRKQMPGFTAVVLTAFLFAIMHMSIHRLIPTFMLGVMLGYLTWRSGSIFPSMLAHATNNGIMVLIMTAHEKVPILAKLKIWIDSLEAPQGGTMQLPPTYMIIVSVAIVASVIIIIENTRKSSEN